MKLKCKLVGRKGFACENCTGIIIVREGEVYLKLKMYGRVPKGCPFTLTDPAKSDKVEVAE